MMKDMRAHGLKRCAATGSLAAASLLMLGASTPQPQSFSFALTNIYVAAYEDEKACRGLSLSSADLFLKSCLPLNGRNTKRLKRYRSCTS